MAEVEESAIIANGQDKCVVILYTGYIRFG
jgi:hypothetical protein